MFEVPAQLLSARARRDYDAATERRREMVREVSPHEWSERQLKAVASVWADATVDVPYYRGLVHSGRAPAVIRGWDDARAIPKLGRQALQDQAAAFVRLSGPPEGYANTAGSTGTPLKIGVNQSERDLVRVVKMAEWQGLGYTRQSRLFLIWGHPQLLGAGWRGRLTGLRRRLADRFLGYRRASAYHLNAERCHRIAEELIAFRPVGIIGYAAALDLFARHTSSFRSRFKALNLGFVLMTTEMPPSADTLPNLSDLFGCPVVQEYGGAEFNQVAFKRGTGPFEVYADLNFFECEAPSPSEPDSHPAIVTPLYWRYTPLVRYEVGDGLIGPERLPHGHVRSFAEVAGRINDEVALGNGDSLHPVAILHCAYNEPDVYNVQMRIVDDGIDLLLVTAPGTARDALERRMRPRLSDVHPLLAAVRFVYVDDVETSRAGKRRWCVDLRTHPPCVASPES